MKPLTLSLTLVAIVSVAVMADQNNPPTHDLDARFLALSDQFVKQSLARSPVGASGAGYHIHVDPNGKPVELDAAIDNLSHEAFQDQRRFYLDWRARFEKETPSVGLSVETRADWALLQDQIALAVLEIDRIQDYRHNPTGYVELIGNALFLPMSQEYASPGIRMGHVLSRMAQIPRVFEQAKQNLSDADPIFIKVAVQENSGNAELIEETVKQAVPEALRARYNEVAPVALRAIADFSRWLEKDLGGRRATRTWRLGQPLYDEKFKHVMQTAVTPAEVLADAARELQAVRTEMLQVALPLHREMFPDHKDHSDLSGRDLENTIISEVLDRIADDHSKRNELVEDVRRDLGDITAFIRAKDLVSLGPRDNLKVIETPAFMRGIYSVAGFHSAPPLEPTAEAQYWVTPIEADVPDDRAESRLREYNRWALKWLTIHEALPGHYVQFEHANNVQPETRRLVRTLFANTPYVEGWAEYIAQVMLDAGFANGDPRFRLVMRKIRLRVITNAILDISLQTLNMTEEAAMELMTKQAFQTQAEAEGKLQRAKLSSAQLPTYYVGLRDLLALRKKAEAAAGSRFDLKAFHDRVLGIGPLPIAYLEQLVLQ